MTAHLSFDRSKHFCEMPRIYARVLAPLLHRKIALSALPSQSVLENATHQFFFAAIQSGCIDTIKPFIGYTCEAAGRSPCTEQGGSIVAVAHSRMPSAAGRMVQTWASTPDLFLRVDVETIAP